MVLTDLLTSVFICLMLLRSQASHAISNMNIAASHVGHMTLRLTARDDNDMLYLTCSYKTFRLWIVSGAVEKYVEDLVANHK